MKQPIFTGAATAIVTPFRENRIDFSALERLTERQNGIDALVVTGTTGEASTLSAAEKTALWCWFQKHWSGTRIYGIGTNSTEGSVELAKQAADCGADALLAVTPYYNKCTQGGLIAHYTALADATPLPLILYNVPSRTGVNLLPQTCQALSEHPRINGVKEASGNLTQIAKIRRLCKDFYIWSGNDDQITATISLGGSGVISVLSNLLPERVMDLTHSALNGDFRRSAALQTALLPLIDALFSEVNPIPIKAALAHLGLCEDELRLPLTPMSPAAREALTALLT